MTVQRAQMLQGGKLSARKHITENKKKVESGNMIHEDDWKYKM